MTNLIHEEEIATYLGVKGYSIKKENISVQEQQLIRKELNVQPFVPKSSFINRNHFLFIENQKRKYMFHAFMVLTLMVNLTIIDYQKVKILI